MSQNVKVFSHLNFDAPIIKGDNWGYLINVLRKCLITGFNERTDLSEIKVTAEDTVILKFLTAHNYQPEQTISITGTPLPDLNSELVIRSVNGLEIICDPYVSLANIVGQEFVGLSGATTKAAPLGFIEEYSENNKSVFRPNETEKNCYLCVDDNMPVGWDNTKNILPLVFMTDKMTDVNTVTGKFIVPYDSVIPNKYKEKIYGATKTGMWHWPSFLIIGTSTNTIAQQGQIVEWNIVGNDKFFYLITRYQSYYAAKDRCFYFGKFKSIIPNDTGNYILMADSFNGTSDYITQYNTGYSGVGPNNSKMSYNKLSYNNITNTVSTALLKNSTGRSPIQPALLPVGESQSKSYIFVSGIQSSTDTNTVSLQYPEKYTNKFNLSKVQITEDSHIRGYIPGLLWQQTKGPYMNLTITRHKYNNKSIRLFQFSIINLSIGAAGNANSAADVSYSISLSTDDWSL